jgi:hypothetical protein
LKYLIILCGSGIQDPGWKKFGSGISYGKNLDPRSGIRDGKFGSRILDKHPKSAKLEIPSPNLLGLKEPNNNQTLCGKAFWDKIKSFLPRKATTVVLKRGKTPVNGIFQSPTRHGRHR